MDVKVINADDDNEYPFVSLEGNEITFDPYTDSTEFETVGVKKVRLQICLPDRVSECWTVPFAVEATECVPVLDIAGYLAVTST